MGRRCGNPDLRAFPRRAGSDSQGIRVGAKCFFSAFTNQLANVTRKSDDVSEVRLALKSSDFSDLVGSRSEQEINDIAFMRLKPI